MLLIRFLPKVLYALMPVVLAAIPVVSQASVVRLQTVLGSIDITLYDTEAPLTVANFLSYVNSGAYNSSFIHRSVPGFIIQGGGFMLSGGAIKAIPASAPVQNEFSASRSNLRGTVAMAKLGNDPNSATNQWFINLADNSSNLDNQNGGFTVFGKVTPDGMKVADAIAALKIIHVSVDPCGHVPALDACGKDTGLLSNLPVVSQPTSGSLQQGNLVTVTSAVNRSDCLFNWAEKTYPQYFSPAGAKSATYTPYYYRYYSGAHNYLAVSSADNNVYVLGPSFGSDITPVKVGPVTDFLGASTCP